MSVYFHYSDVIMGEVASQIASVSSVYSTVCLGVDQRKHQRSASLASVRGIHRWPVNSPHKGPVMRKMFPFDDVIMYSPEAASANINRIFMVGGARGSACSWGASCFFIPYTYNYWGGINYDIYVKCSVFFHFARHIVKFSNQENINEKSSIL